MRVVVNQQAALGLKTGIGHYTIQLLHALRAQPGHHQIDAFPEGWMWQAGQMWSRLRPVLQTESGPVPARAASCAGGWERFRRRSLKSLRKRGRKVARHLFRTICTREKYDLYHEPNFIPLAADCPTVVTLHDLSVLLYPEWHPAERVAYFERHFHRGLAACSHFFVVSDFTRKEVLRTLHLPPDQVTRVYNGIRADLGPWPENDVQEVLRRLRLPPQYLLYLGTIEPRKNVLGLLRAYCALPQALRERWPLLLVGGWGWHAEGTADFFHREARHRGVIHVGYLADRHLPAVYNGARALVYPSFYEGFGLPPVEMMACGGAVLASTTGAVAEVVGSQAHLVDPHDIDGWRDALVRVVQDQDWWQALRRGTRGIAARYSWGRCAAETLQVYRNLAGEPGQERRLAA
jgi:alpha-1,3-rhamnosyl/mannosyltransferase